MLGAVKILESRVAKEQGGFTLIEMIVVVGIIAVLAAVIVPNNLRFMGSGEQGAKDAEAVNVQTAMHGMMGEQAIAGVDAHDGGTSSNASQSWSTLPTGTDAVPLSGYLRAATTTYFYCYDADGDVTEQFETAAPCTL